MKNQDDARKIVLLIDLVGTKPNTVRTAAKQIFSEFAVEYSLACGDKSIKLDTTEWMELLNEIGARLHQSDPRPPHFNASYYLIHILNDLQRMYRIIGIGNSQSPAEFRKACDKFFG